MLRGSVGYMLRSAKKKAGIRAKWTLHDLRRTAARKLYATTGDIRQAQKFLGHGSINATMWYLSDPQIQVQKADVERAMYGKEKS